MSLSMKKAWTYFLGEDDKTNEASNTEHAEQHIIHLNANLVSLKVPHAKDSLKIVEIPNELQNRQAVTRKEVEPKALINTSLSLLDSITSSRVHRMKFDETEISNEVHVKDSHDFSGQTKGDDEEENSLISDKKTILGGAAAERVALYRLVPKSKKYDRLVSLPQRKVEMNTFLEADDLKKYFNKNDFDPDSRKNEDENVVTYSLSFAKKTWNPFGVPGRQQDVNENNLSEIEGKCFLKETNEDGSSVMTSSVNVCLQDQGVPVQNIIEDLTNYSEAIIEAHDSEEVGNVYSDTDPFGFEAIEDTEVRYEKRARALEEDPFGFEEEDDDQEALLESFRINSADAFNKENDSSLKYSQNHHDTRIVADNEPHPNQALFDILDRNIQSIKPFKVRSKKEVTVAEDVKLCFVAFVMVFSPPRITPYAEEYNHDLDDNLQLHRVPSEIKSTVRQNGWFFQRKKDVSERTVKYWHDDTSEEGNDEEKGSTNKENENYTSTKKENEGYSCTYIPLNVVYALWTEVFKNEITGLEVMNEEHHVRDSIFSYIKESLVQLELVDSREEPSSNQFKAKNQIDIIDNLEKNVRRQPVTSGNESSFEVLAVHHAISQQYGEHLVSDKFRMIYRKRKEQWFSAVLAAISEDFCVKEYSIRVLPHTMIEAGKHLDAKKLLCDKVFIRKRMQAFGILEGTTTHVTDVDELLASAGYIEGDDKIVDGQESIITAYEHVKRNIERTFKGMEASKDPERNDLDFYAAYNESGKAFHLMALSLGEQGILEKAEQYFLEALRLKRLGVKNEGESTVSISDTLHCIGFMHDNSSAFTDALVSYKEALQLRIALLGNDSLRVAETCHNMGATLCEDQQFEEAIFFLEKALKIRICHFGDEHECVADTQQWMGNVMRELGNYEEALDYFNDTLRIKKQWLGDEDLSVASVLHNKAIVLEDLGDYLSCIKCYKEALRIRELHTDRNSLIVADTLQCIGNSCKASGDHTNALSNFMDSINAREKILKDEDIAVDFVEWHIGDVQPISDDVHLQYKKLIECYEEILHLTNNSLRTEGFLERMGEIYAMLRDWDNSEESFRGALKLGSNIQANDKVIRLLKKLGQVYILKAEYTEAQSYLTDALAEQKCLRSINPPFAIYNNDEEQHQVNDKAMKSLAMINFLIGVCFNKLNQYQPSLISFTECLRILKKEDKRDVLIGHTLHWLGRQHHGLQEYNKAISRYISALRVYKENKPNINHQMVIQTLHSLGNAHFKNDQLQTALKCYNEEIKLFETSRSLLHSSNVAEAFYSAGNIYAKMKFYDKAIAFFVRSLSEMGLEDGVENASVAKGLDKLGTMYKKQNDHFKAKEILSQARVMFQNVLGHHDLQGADIAFKLGQVLDEVKDLGGAMDYYKECLQIREMKLSPDHENIAATLLFMGKNCYAQSKFDNAIKFLQRSLDIRRKVLSENDIVVALTLHELGKTYSSNNAHDKALVCYRESFRIWKTAGSIDEAGKVCFDMAMSHEASYNLEVAAKSYNECLELFTATNHKLLPSINHRFGMLYEKMGNYTDAVTQLERCIEAYKSRGESNELRTSVMSSLCRSKVMVAKGLMKKGRFTESHRIETSGSDHVTIETSLNGVSTAQSTMISYFTEALCHYNKLQKLIELKETKSAELANTYFEIGDIYVTIKDNCKAKENYEKSLRIWRSLEHSDENSMAKCLLSLSVLNKKESNISAASSHAIEALRIFKLKRNYVDAAASLSLLAHINELNCNIKAAVECFEECLKLKKQMDRSSNLSVASSLQDFASLLIRNGDDDRALELLQDAVRIRKTEVGLENSLTAESLQSIGEILMEKGHFEKALKYFNIAVQVKIRICGIDHQDLAAGQRLRGVAHYECGRFEEAIFLLKDALCIEEKSNATKVNLACTLHYLGRAFCKTLDYEIAVEYLTEASTIRKQELGPESMEYADSLKCLGYAYYALERSDEALNYFLDSLRIYKVKDCDDMKIAKIQEIIGNTLLRLEKYEKSLAMFMNCLPTYEVNLGHDNKSLGNIFFSMGRIQAKLSKYKAATDHFKHSLRIRKQEMVGTTAVVEVLMELGDLFLQQSKFEEALDCFHESLRLLKKRNMNDDECIASVLRNIGCVYIETGKSSEAMISFKESQSLYSNKLGDQCFEVGQLSCNIAHVFETLSNFDDAIGYYMNAYNILREHIDHDDSSFAQIFHHLGCIYAKLKRFTESEEYCQKALEIWHVKLDTNHLDIAETLIILANVKAKMKEIENALSLYEEAYRIYIIQKEEMAVANCLESMAFLKLEIDETDDALSLYNEAWEIYRTQKAENTIEAANILFGLGIVHQKKLEHEDAFNFLKYCLNVQMVKKGKHNIDVAKTCKELGHVLVSLNKFEEALKLYQTSLTILKQLPDGNNLFFAGIKRRVGEILSQLRKYDLALEHFTVCLEIYKVEIGEISEEVADVSLSIGEIYDLQVDKESALNFFFGALKIRKALYGKNDMKVGQTLYKIACVLEDWRDIDEAMVCFRDALHIYQLELGKDNKSVAVVLNRIGCLHLEREGYKDALQAFDGALLIYRRNLGEDCSEVGLVLQHMGGVYDSIEEFDEALRCYSKSLDVLKKSHGNKSLVIALTLNNLGINLARRKEFNKAVECCTEALHIRKLKLSEDHLDIADTLYNIGNIFDDWGTNDDHTMKFYNEALAIYRSNRGDCHIDVANCLQNIGLVQMKRNQNCDAISQLSDALRIVRLEFGCNSLNVAGVLFHLGRVYGKQANYEKSLGCFKESLRIRMEQLDHNDLVIVTTRQIVEKIQRKIDNDPIFK